MGGTMTEQPQQLGVVRTYSDLHSLMRQRADALNVSRLVLDEASGLPSGYCGKILAKSQPRKLGRLGFELMLGALGMVLIAVEDKAAQVRLSRLQKRQMPPRYASDDMLPKEKPKRRQHLPRGTDWARQMNARRSVSLSGYQRSRIARQAARVRWGSA
jgi:hypothetical protein